MIERYIVNAINAESGTGINDPATTSCSEYEHMHKIPRASKQGKKVKIASDITSQFGELFLDLGRQVESVILPDVPHFPTEESVPITESKKVSRAEKKATEKKAKAAERESKRAAQALLAANREAQKAAKIATREAQRAEKAEAKAEAAVRKAEAKAEAAVRKAATKKTR